MTRTRSWTCSRGIWSDRAGPGGGGGGGGGKGKMQSQHSLESFKVFLSHRHSGTSSLRSKQSSLRRRFSTARHMISTYPTGGGRRGGGGGGGGGGRALCHGSAVRQSLAFLIAVDSGRTPRG